MIFIASLLISDPQQWQCIRGISQLKRRCLLQHSHANQSLRPGPLDAPAAPTPPHPTTPRSGPPQWPQNQPLLPAVAHGQSWGGATEWCQIGAGAVHATHRYASHVCAPSYGHTRAHCNRGSGRIPQVSRAGHNFFRGRAAQCGFCVCVLPTWCLHGSSPLPVWNNLGAVSIRKTVLPGMAIPMLKIRRPNGRLIFNMEIAIRR